MQIQIIEIVGMATILLLLMIYSNRLMKVLLHGQKLLKKLADARDATQYEWDLRLKIANDFINNYWQHLFLFKKF